MIISVIGRMRETKLSHVVPMLEWIAFSPCQIMPDAGDPLPDGADIGRATADNVGDGTGRHAFGYEFGDAVMLGHQTLPPHTAHIPVDMEATQTHVLIAPARPSPVPVTLG